MTHRPLLAGLAAIAALVVIAMVGLLLYRPAPAPRVTATPASPPVILRRLTSGGCCTAASWSPDSQRVLFVDRPAGDRPAAIWGVAIDPPGGSPEVYLDRVGFYSPDLSFVSYPENGRSIVERRTDGRRWTLENGGRRVLFSLDLKRMAWEVVPDEGPVNSRQAAIWVADLEAGPAREVAVLPGGGLDGWLPDGRLVVDGRRSEEEVEPGLFILSPGDGSLTELARAARISGISIAPGGRWVAYAVTLSGDANRDGVWIVRTDGSGSRKMDFFGAYQWRDPSHLVYVPLRGSAADSHEFWQVDAATGEKRRLTDPATARFSIAQGDWAVSPDGRRAVFLSTQDHNLWVVELAK